jgi:hypothetical protein
LIRCDGPHPVDNVDNDPSIRDKVFALFAGRGDADF